MSSATERDPVVEIQRRAVLDAMVAIVAERGYADASLGEVLARARVSRKSFYELFASREECILAILDEAMQRAATLIAQAFAGAQSWLDGVLAAAAAVLAALDREPLTARVLLVEAAGAGSRALERRLRNVDTLRALIVAHWSDAPAECDFAALADRVMASILGVLHDHLVRGEPAPLITLLGPLMGVIAGAYLDAGEVAHEVRRGDELARAMLARAAPPARESAAAGCGEPLPAGLRDPRAHRARSCVVFLASHPGASGRQIAQGIGLRGHSQVSTLLRRLERAGLLLKRAGPRGGSNEWRLSPRGRQAAEVLAA